MVNDISLREMKEEVKKIDKVNLVCFNQCARFDPAEVE